MAGFRRERVEGAAGDAQDLHAARGAGGEGLDQVDDDLEVEAELPLVVVEAAGAQTLDHGVEAAMDVFGALRPGRVAGERQTEESVGARLNPEVDALAALAGL